MPVSRRGFVVTGISAGAALVIGFSLPQKLWSQDAPAKPPGPPASPFEAWVHIGEDDRVRLIVAKVRASRPRCR